MSLGRRVGEPTLLLRGRAKDELLNMSATISGGQELEKMATLPILRGNRQIFESVSKSQLHSYLSSDIEEASPTNQP